MPHAGRRAVWFHRISAMVWTASTIPALLWWRESLWFVITASIYANIKSDWGAAEAADNSAVLDALADLSGRLAALEALLTTRLTLCACDPAACTSTRPTAPVPPAVSACDGPPASSPRPEAPPV